MRYAQRDMRPLHYAERLEDAKDPDSGEVTPVYGDPKPMMADWQSEGGQVAAAEYGERLPYVRRLYGCSAALAPGMGVWLEAGTDEEPDYEVISDTNLPQQRDYTIQRRGGYGG